MGQNVYVWTLHWMGFELLWDIKNATQDADTPMDDSKVNASREAPKAPVATK